MREGDSCVMCVTQGITKFNLMHASMELVAVAPDAVRGANLLGLLQNTTTTYRTEKALALADAQRRLLDAQRRLLERRGQKHISESKCRDREGGRMTAHVT